MDTHEKNLKDFSLAVLAVILIVSIGFCIKSYHSCQKQLKATQEQREYQVPNIKID
jgi:hypothetical protein